MEVEVPGKARRRKEVRAVSSRVSVASDCARMLRPRCAADSRSQKCARQGARKPSATSRGEWSIWGRGRRKA